MFLFSSNYIPNQQASAAGTLTNELVLSSDNQISLQSIHVIEFTTVTAGTIKTITITYPAGFNLASEHLIQAAGIGAGTLSVAGQTLTYTVNSAVPVSLGTGITITIGGIVNAGTAGSKTVSVTTKDPSKVIIDGPTTSTAFPLTGVTAAMINNNAVSSAKIANGAVTNTKIASNSINSTQIIDGSIKGADIVSGALLTGPVSIDSPTFQVDSVTHRVAIGKSVPTAQLDVLGDIKGSNNMIWNGGKSVLSSDQGGSISLGDGLTPGLIPYIDFHYGKGVSQAFNMRLINNADGLLSLYGGVLSVNDSVYVGAKSNPAPGANSLYLKNDQGDGFDTLRLDGSGNNLYIIAKSDPGAVTGAGIVFRTAPAGGGELDRMTIDPAGNLNINAGGKFNCAGCVNSADVAPGIQVIDCTNLVPSANLMGCDLHGMDLHGKDLHNVNLSGAILFGANLSAANLSAANLSGAQLDAATLIDTNFRAANLSGAILTNADLTNTHFDNAVLFGTGANLSGANLYQAVNQPTGSINCAGTPIAAAFTCIIH